MRYYSNFYLLIIINNNESEKITRVKYLFFDIECANCDGGRGKICSFGYVLTDTSFSVLDHKDLIMDPSAPFRLQSYGREAKKYIELAYPEDVFRASPRFDRFYDRLKELLCTPGTLVFGYAPENDAGFLASEFERYSLTPLDFEFCDVQRIFKRHMRYEGANQFSLTHACDALGIDAPETAHKSVDDAMATMRVLKKICFEEGRGAPELVDLYSPCTGELRAGEMKVSYFKKKPEPAPGEENLMKGVNEDNFKKLIKRTRCNFYGAPPQLRGKRLCFTYSYEFEHYGEMCILVGLLAEHGARITRKAGECDIYVQCHDVSADGKRSRCRRRYVVDKRRSAGENVRYVRFETLLGWLGADEEGLTELAAQKRTGLDAEKRAELAHLTEAAE